MTTNKTDEPHLLTQSLPDTNTTTNVHTVLPRSSSMSSTRESKRTRTISQPKGTASYTVAENDTLERVALLFNATPSELLQLNKMNSRTIFPGQELYVPDENALNDSNQQQATNSPSPPPVKPKEDDALVHDTDRRLSDSTSPPSQPQSKQEVGPVVWSMTRQISALLGRAERLRQGGSTESEPSSRTIEENASAQKENDEKQTKKLEKSLSVEKSPQPDDDCAERFIKAHVRLMTEDHESVGGTLLVTPNAVMFDPDVLDPLIKANSIDKYGLIIRMDFVAGVSLYEDLAIFEHEATARDEEKRKSCHSISVKHLQHNQTNIPLNTDEEQIHDLMLSLLDQIDKDLNPSSATDTCMLFDASSTVQRRLSKTFSATANNSNDKTFLPISQDKTNLKDSLQLSSDSFQPLNDYKHSIGILQQDNEDGNPNYHRYTSEASYVFDWSRFKRVVNGKKTSHLENCVPLDQFNKRFEAIDKLIYQQQQNYFQPHQIEVPYYLCIQTSMHTYDIPSLYPREYKRPSEINVENFSGKKQLEYYYWFAVPKEKTAPLYAFFLRWTPERQLQPPIDDDQLDSENKSPEKGFVLLPTDDSELANNHDESQHVNTKPENKPHYLTQQNTLMKDWESTKKTRKRTMIGTLSTTSTNTSCSSNEQQQTSPRPRRFTLHSLASRLSDSKKNFLEQIPHHQQQLTRFRKRAKSFLSSTLIDHLADIHPSSSERRNSTTGIISVDEIYRRTGTKSTKNSDFYDSGIPTPKLLHRSSLINDEQAKLILLELPFRFHGLDWFMEFSTETHGFSLNQLYRRSMELEHGLPSLLIVKDVAQNVFGGFVPHQLLMSDTFYGTGETFLFTFCPEFRVFNWSGYNEYFVKGDLHSLGFGSGEGKYGLWIDSDLYRGRTCPSKTFNSEPLTITEDFIIANIEVWTFID